MNEDKEFKCGICGQLKAGIAQRSPERNVCINCYLRKK